jgi:hypothetical protein
LKGVVQNKALIEVVGDHFVGLVKARRKVRNELSGLDDILVELIEVMDDRGAKVQQCSKFRRGVEGYNERGGFFFG